MKVPPVLAIKLVWLGACVAVLYYSLSNPNFYTNGEFQTFFELKMIALTLPLGLLVPMFLQSFFIVIDQIGTIVEAFISLRTSYAIFWLFMVIVGYFQWFFLHQNLFGKLSRQLEAVDFIQSPLIPPHIPAPTCATTSAASGASAWPSFYRLPAAPAGPC